MTARRTRLKQGDVFTIPLGDGRVNLGQVVAPHRGHAWYMTVFDGAEDPEVAARRDVTTKDPLFAALTLDVLFDLGDWEVVGHAAVDPSAHLPAYKVSLGTPDNVVIEDLDGSRQRRATEVDMATIPFRKTHGPVLLQHAVRAHEGLEPWLDYYDSARLDARVLAEDAFGLG